MGRLLHYDVRVSYISRAPTPPLRDIVERLWRVEDACPSPTPETICPDGCAEIVLHLGEAMQGQPRHVLVGQMYGPMAVRAAGPVVMLGARLTPFGLRRLLPMPQERLAGTICALGDVWQHWAERIADQMASACDAVSQLRLLDAAIVALLRQSIASHPDRVVQAAVRDMRRQQGPVSVDSVAAAGGISRRQLERRFRDHVGLSPHLFGRIVRFQHAFAALGHEPGAALAARLGYVDQAHMVREVRRFSGQTPTLLADAHGLTSFFANAADL
jgi:AraC-like DNA-binding protein